MNLITEKESKLSAQDRYQILSEAMEMAEEENGFINSFIYQRSIYICAAKVLYPEIEEDINSSLLENVSPLIVWDKLLEQETIDQMVAEYETELNVLADEGQIWFDEYTEASHSMRAMVDAIQILMDNLAGNMGKQLEMFKQDADINAAKDIAEKWGLNNKGEVSLF